MHVECWRLQWPASLTLLTLRTRTKIMTAQVNITIVFKNRCMYHTPRPRIDEPSTNYSFNGIFILGMGVLINSRDIPTYLSYDYFALGIMR